MRRICHTREIGLFLSKPILKCNLNFFANGASDQLQSSALTESSLCCQTCQRIFFLPSKVLLMDPAPQLA